MGRAGHLRDCPAACRHHSGRPAPARVRRTSAAHQTDRRTDRPDLGHPLVPSLPFEYTAIILATFAGLVAGGGSTLMADAVAFRLYSLCMLLPVTFSVVLSGTDRLHLIPAFLTLCVAGFMVRFNTQAYRALVDHLETRAALEHASASITMLGGLLPICASCKQIRDDRGYWSQIEEYISRHTETSFSHGICPDCAHRLYPDFVSAAYPIQVAAGST